MINTAAMGQVRRSCPVFIWYVLLKRNSPTERTEPPRFSWRVFYL
ncbi:hypothetical protein ECDEC5E_4059 [Escherichia coli DEC5E]|nr:hypothetical protein ECDEC5E_4059 [Escherichia coli DEC5E]